MKFSVVMACWLPLALASCACNSNQKPKAPPVEPSATHTSASSDQAALPGVPPGFSPSGIRVYVGSGDWGAATGAVSVFVYDVMSGALSRTSRIDAGGLLSFLAADSQHRYLYAADEEQKKLRSFAINADDGSLTEVATVDTIAGAVYVSIPKNDRFILAAQFNSGKTESFELDGKGGFGKRTAEVSSGKESHGVFLSPDERFAFVPGRASDQVQGFAFDATAGTLAPQAAAHLPKGAGSRHLDFHPNGKFAYLVNEFANTIVAFTYDQATGALSEVQTISTEPDAGVQSSAADIHVHPNGKFLYATNRPVGADGSIVAYAIADDGKLTLLEKESTHGRVPRNFHIVADGTRLIVGNQESKSVQSFVIDEALGTLTPQALTALDVKPFFVADL